MMPREDLGVVRVKDVGTHWVDVIPLTFGRARIVVVPKIAPFTYDDGW
jgi:hypothetical protein